MLDKSVGLARVIRAVIFLHLDFTLFHSFRGKIEIYERTAQTNATNVCIRKAVDDVNGCAVFAAVVQAILNGDQTAISNSFIDSIGTESYGSGCCCSVGRSGGAHCSRHYEFILYLFCASLGLHVYEFVCGDFSYIHIPTLNATPHGAALDSNYLVCFRDFLPVSIASDENLFTFNLQPICFYNCVDRNRHFLHMFFIHILFVSFVNSKFLNDVRARRLAENNGK